MQDRRATHADEASITPIVGGDERPSILSRKLLAAEEGVRQRLSAALHDGVGQDLTAARIKMNLLKEALSSADHAESLAEVIKLVDRAARSVSSLTFELCPPLLYEEGLRAALAWLVGQFSRRCDTAFELVASGPPRPMSYEVRGLMFQIVRELLTNVVKHARAGSATVICETRDREMTVTVNDDGVGFDPAAVGKLSDGTGGFGLFSIRRRLRHVGGRLEIRSGLHRGSRISVVVPFKKNKMAIRILLVDDHEIVLDGFRSLLEKQPDVEVVGQATDGRAALDLVRELSPNVVIMDVAMPNLNGVEATRRIVHDCPDVEVLALSMHSSQRVVTHMLRAGASGYLLKTCAPEELARAVRIVAGGGTYLSPEVAGSVVKGYVQHIPPERQSPCASLSPREREVLQCVAEGKSTKEIASALHVSVKTIEAHRSHIMDKLGIRTIAGLTKYAVREGLTPLES